jgi:glycine/D-amino acid oxidase-like deaminating enzyme
MTTDYLIIGQGICGSFLSWNLLKAGKQVMVADESLPHTASKVASGVINPVTGRRIVRTWEIEKLMPFAVDAYTQWGREMQANLIRQCNILDFHPTPQMMLAFDERLPVEKEYLRRPGDTDQWKTYFNYPFGVGEINPCWLVELHTLLRRWRKQLQEQGLLLEEKFNWQDCEIFSDHVRYRNITASKIICCEGAAGFSNPYFKLLPYAPNKGQAVIVRIPGLPRSHIFKQGINLVPWDQDELFWVGSTYEWDFTNLDPSPDFLQKITHQLAYWLKLPFTVVDHLASERPANLERRPFVGLHPLFPSVGLFNGMGTKGCSLAPYFAKEFTDHLVNGSSLTPQADIRRFTKILGAGKAQ